LKLKRHQFDTMDNIQKNMATELTTITTDEFSKYFQRLCSVIDPLGTILREMSKNHIVLCIAIFILFQSHYSFATVYSIKW
jgi:hypothetical protein